MEYSDASEIPAPPATGPRAVRGTGNVPAMSTDDRPTDRHPVPPAAYPWAGVDPRHGWPPPYVAPAPRTPFMQTRLGALVLLVGIIVLMFIASR